MTTTYADALKLGQEARLRRTGVLGYLFLLWLLLLPFTLLTQQAMGTIAPDKTLALILLICWIFRNQRLDSRRVTAIMWYVIIGSFFIIAKNISFVSARDIFYSNMWADAVRMGYFILPVLYIRHIHDLHRVNNIVIIVAIVGYMSAFLVALGLISLPIERISASRFGLALPKTIGLFPSYGDLAQFTAYVLLLTAFVPKADYFWGFGNRFVKSIVLVAAFAGFSASQSRNILLSTALAVGVGFILSRMSKKSRGATGYAVLLSGVAVVLAAIVFFGAEISGGISKLGGGTGAATASIRLEQYRMTYEIFSQSPLLGASAATFRKLGAEIDGTHNMWLALAAHGGLLCVIVLLALLARSLLSAAPLLKFSETRPMAVVVCGYFVALMLSVQFYPGQTSMFWVLLGIASSLGSMDRPTGARDTDAAGKT